MRRGDFIMRQLTKAAVAAIVLFAVLAGCGTTGQTQNSDRYGDDGYMGISNSNPNLQTSPTYHTYNKDVKLMTQTLERIDGIEDARIMMDGNRAHVEIRVAQNLSESDAVYVQQQAISSLRSMMPRYKIEVTRYGDSR